MTPFDRATAVAPAGDGAYSAEIDPAWNTPAGPNGGYVAAIVVRALAATVADPGRPLRSVTLHYLRPPHAGPARVEVTVERAGRGLTSLSARLVQDDRVAVLALAAFAADYPVALDYAEPPPAVRPWDEARPVRRPEGAPPITQWFEARPTFGDRLFSGSAQALTGGWLRLLDAPPLDAPLLAMYADAWMPAAFTRLQDFGASPTIELTIHMRAHLDLPAGEPVLARFSSRTSRDGFAEEDGELWAADGTLVAQSRQLALLSPLG